MSSVGTVVFDRDNTSNGSVGTNYGYVNPSWQLRNDPIKRLVLIVPNDYLIEAYKSGATLYFRITFNEDKGPKSQILTKL